MKKLAFILLLFTFHVSRLTFDVLAQQPTQEWVARYTGPSSDLFGPFLQVDKQGNSYIAGTHVVNDTINILCAKYNTDGAQLWATLYKYPGYGYFGTTGLALDSSGNAYVIAGFAPTSSTPVNALIVKFNVINGSPDWAKAYFGQYSLSAFYDIKIDRLNNIYVVGGSDSSHLVIRYNTNGDSVWVRKYHLPSALFETALASTLDDSLNIIFTGRRRFSIPRDSLLVVKYSSGGILRWVSVYVYDILVNRGTKITADQNGNLYIGGVTRVSGLGVYLTLKYDRNGLRQWAKIYYETPQSGDNRLGGIAMDSVNNALYVTGIGSAFNNSFAATIKYNPINGDSVWVRRDTGIYKNGSSGDIAIDKFGSIYITGATNNIPPGSAIDILTIKYSSQGNRVWLITYNGPFYGGDGGYALRLDTANNVYVMGISQSSEQIFDYIVIKYSQILGIIKNTNNIPNKFYLNNYPNPFNSQTDINFGISHNSTINIKIYDILGREIETLVNNDEIKAGEYKIKWNAFNYSSGIYFCRINATHNKNSSGQNFAKTIKLVFLK